jgi:hypothetical protein
MLPFVLLMQAVDNNSLNVTLEKWFEGLDVDRSGVLNLKCVRFCAYLIVCFVSVLQILSLLLNFKLALLLMLARGVDLDIH